MNEQKNIVVLGAGYGGILTAKKLARKLKKNDSVKVTVIDKNTYHTMLTELHEVAANRVPEEAIRIDLDKALYGRNIDIVLDEIQDIDFKNKSLKGLKDTYNYDYLVMGTGSKPTFFGCKGAEEHALTLWSYEDALKIKFRILDAFQKASVAKTPEERKHLLTFVVIGCGFTGIEMIGELAEWKDELCLDFNIPIEEVNLLVVDMLPKVLPMFEDKLIQKTEKRLNKLGVEVLTNSSIIEVKADGLVIKDKDPINCATTIWAAGVEGSDLMGKLSDDKITKLARNRIQTDEHLRSVEHKDVFIVGDNIFYIAEGEDRPVPQMVENAEHSARLVAHNVAATINEKELDSYKPEFHGAMVCIGGRYGVAQIETKNKKFVFAGFIAMFIKHFVNMIYFFDVLGFNKMWNYMIHEIFHVRNRRSFLGGHFSKRSSNFWMVPLRLFVGGKWLLEGVAKLGKVVEDPNNIFLLPSKLAVSGASEVVDEVAEVAKLAADASVFETLVFYAEKLSTWEWALPVPQFITNIVDWSMNLVFYQPSGEFTSMATVFQTGMVIMEILVGLALIAGLFTMVSSVASIAMGAMIWASGSAPVEMLWYMAAGVALIAGSGSTFGLDYYVLPWLKKHWKKLKFIRKWYLYT